MNKESIEELYQTVAFHEAGHAVAYIYYGRNTHVFMLDRESMRDSLEIDFLGKCSQACPDDKCNPLRSHQFRVMKLAGPLGEMLALEPDYYLNCGEDEWLEMALALVDENTNDDYPKDCTDGQRWRAAREAMRLLRELRDMQTEIAEALMANPCVGWTSFSSLSKPCAAAHD